MSQLPSYFACDQQRKVTLNQSNNTFPIRPARCASDNKLAKQRLCQDSSQGVNPLDGSFQKDRMPPRIVNASVEYGNVGVTAPIQNHGKILCFLDGDVPNFQGPAQSSFPWRATNVSIITNTEPQVILTPLVAGRKPAPGNYARLIAAWDSKVPIGRKFSIDTDAMEPRGPWIPAPEIGETSNTQDLDELCQQAAQLLVVGQVEPITPRGIWESLPVSDIQARPVDRIPENNLPAGTVTNGGPTESAIKARKPLPVPSSRKLESSIHATAPAVKNHSERSKRSEASKGNPRIGMRGGAKIASRKMTGTQAEAQGTDQSTWNRSQVSALSPQVASREIWC
ncbi:hypothetical protein NliqN6_3736 [Naganishia liquefaciens]|uniref:Uncharacterized protein n=1 Tax=Naganishia liquefaciens TaxID=104408 RepID=A0A8H3TW70_9TREE|nr:hypothetical protein NliqN6_3736 [Naganishia liquefaciens]